MFDYVVMPSGSCGGHVKMHYLELFRDDPDLSSRAEQLADATYELTDFLANVAEGQERAGTVQRSHHLSRLLLRAARTRRQAPAARAARA